MVSLNYRTLPLESTFARRAKFSHAWPLELGFRTPTLRCGHLSARSRTTGGFFDFEVGGHGGAYEGREHVYVICWAKKWKFN